MDIINNFCKSRNFKLIDISHLDIDGMLKMIEKTKFKYNVILLINIDKCSKKSKRVLEDIDQQKLDNVYQLIYNNKSLSLPHFEITDKILNRWVDELTEGNCICPICLEDCFIDNFDSVVCPVCMSMYCHKCLEEYKKNECSVCRSKVLYEKKYQY